MSIGVIILAHQSLHRTIEVARHWLAGGVPVVIHIDAKVPDEEYRQVADFAEHLPTISLSKRYRCEWGNWGIVEATQAAAEVMLEKHPEVQHVYLTSGACLPLRPIAELKDYLAERPDTDFIESATTSDVEWTVGGLNEERFTLRFPFLWRKQRKLFDFYVNLQRKLKVKRTIPKGIVPHMGSQWWCLTRATLSGILNDPDRDVYEKYFKSVWIPDESYFQTLARLYSKNIESRTLTLMRFDYHGRPFVFYDDHLALLRRTDCFVARKIWSGADALYKNFLSEAQTRERDAEPNPARVESVFARATLRRTRGRPGLFMQSRFPNPHLELDITASRYSVFEGFDDVFMNFEHWLKSTTQTLVHGHLYAPKRVEFENRVPTYMGALSDSAKLRDYNAKMFLSNLIWNARGEYQCFQFGPADQQDVHWDLVKDRNASISVISGAWLVPLSHDERDFKVLRAEAARLQKVEREHLDALRSVYAKAHFNIWTLAEFLEKPMQCLQLAIADIPGEWERRLTEVPKMCDLSRLLSFTQNLNNQGMHPYLAGDVESALKHQKQTNRRRKSYVIE